MREKDEMIVCGLLWALLPFVGIIVCSIGLSKPVHELSCINPNSKTTACTLPDSLHNCTECIRFVGILPHASAVCVECTNGTLPVNLCPRCICWNGDVYLCSGRHTDENPRDQKLYLAFLVICCVIVVIIAVCSWFLRECTILH